MDSPHPIDARRGPHATQRPRTTFAALLLAGAIALGLPGGLVTFVVNLDPVTYSAASSGLEVAIPPAGMVGPELYPSVAIPKWELGFICTPGGWRSVHGAVVVFSGRAIGSSRPPADWRPPHSC